MSEILERPQPMPAFGMMATEEWNVQDYLATKLLSHDFLTKAQALIRWRYESVLTKWTTSNGMYVR